MIAWVRNFLARFRAARCTEVDAQQNVLQTMTPMEKKESEPPPPPPQPQAKKKRRIRRVIAPTVEIVNNAGQEFTLTFKRPNCCFNCRKLFGKDAATVPAHLHKICKRHVEWPASEEAAQTQFFLQMLLLQASKEKVATESNEEVGESAGLAQFRRFCMPCYEKILFDCLESDKNIVMLNSVARVECPFCPAITVGDGKAKKSVRKERLDTDEMLLLLDTVEKRERASHLLWRAKQSRKPGVFFCPVDKCRYFQQQSANNKIKCPIHGGCCVLCWKPLDELSFPHACLGVPGEFSTICSVRRCPACQMPFDRGGGCRKINCRCGHQLNWTKDAIKTSVSINNDAEWGNHGEDSEYEYETESD